MAKANFDYTLSSGIQTENQPSSKNIIKRNQALGVLSAPPDDLGEKNECSSNRQAQIHCSLYSGTSGGGVSEQK
jgi:hypothetical protein